MREPEIGSNENLIYRGILYQTKFISLLWTEIICTALDRKHLCYYQFSSISTQL